MKDVFLVTSKVSVPNAQWVMLYGKIGSVSNALVIVRYATLPRSINV